MAGLTTPEFIPLDFRDISVGRDRTAASPARPGPNGDRIERLPIAPHFPERAVFRVNFALKQFI